jgi:phage terminase large subunit-like protein
VELDELPPKVQFTRLLEEKVRRRSRRMIEGFYPEKGPLRRELYPKHQAFLAAGQRERVRMMMAANRSGKSIAGLYETVLHMTGKYPAWWKGKRFDGPVRVWVAGDTGKTLREILQVKLLGPWANFGTGLVPGDDLIATTSKQGVAEAIDTFSVRHVRGGVSHGVFKSYDQGRKAFQGSEQDVILLDEEPPLDVYSECLVRTMTTGGIVMLTFTPLQGVTALIKEMREAGAWEIGATWDDAPHLSQDEKEDLWKNTPAYMRDARAKGIPSRGSGVVFPVAEETLLIEPFSPLPSTWAFIGGLDFGWDHPMAAVKLAHDRDADIIYVVGQHRMKEASPVTFAAGVRPWGKWLPWAWPHDGLRHDRGTGRDSGKQWSQLFEQEGMNMLPGPASFDDEKLDHGVEAGIAGMLTYMEAGRFKVMAHLEQWRQEFRDYYRKDGIIVKERDDLLDATRTALMMIRYAIRKPSRPTLPSGRYNWRTL